MKKTKEVKTYLVEQECDVCKKGTLVGGDLVSQGGVILIPIRYTHKCDNEECTNVEEFEEKYPYTTYSKV